jgi:hypothetical protein
MRSDSSSCTTQSDSGFVNRRLRPVRGSRRLSVLFQTQRPTYFSLSSRRLTEPFAVPLEADHCLRLEQEGSVLTHDRLREDRPLSDEEVLRYLAHSRLTEQRAAEEIELQLRIFEDDPEVGKAIRMIADDEVNHLSFCHEELLRFAAQGHAGTIRRMLPRYGLAEIRVYREVSAAFVRRMAAPVAAVEAGGPPLRRTRHLRRRAGMDLAAHDSASPPERPNALGEHAGPRTGIARSLTTTGGSAASEAGSPARRERM